MSLVEIAEALARSMRQSSTLLQHLAKGLRDRRTQWISARPSALREPAESLEELTNQLQQEDRRREELLAKARAAFPARPYASGPLHVDVSLLKQHLPPAVAGRLEQAANASTTAAKAVRRELALGQRLLRFTQHAHETLLDGVGENVARTRDDVGSYDRNARRMQTALPGTGPAPGTLVDGRM